MTLFCFFGDKSAHLLSDGGTKVRAQLDQQVVAVVDDILKSPETTKKICSVLDSELVGKVIQLVKLPVNQVSMTKRVEHELQLHVPLLVAKV